MGLPRAKEATLHAISPREIQARVRAGAAPEVIAAENNWPLDKVLRYAEPVLGERAYVCELAQGVELHRSRGVVVLADAVSARKGDPGPWDSWRGEDGSWHVTVEIPGDGQAEWVFEPVGRTVQPRNELARALMEVGPAGTSSNARKDEVADSSHDTVIVDRPVRTHLAVVPETDSATEETPHEPPSVQQQEFDDMPAGKSRKSRKGRAHVPSWDEILFGTKSSE